MVLSCSLQYQCYIGLYIVFALWYHMKVSLCCAFALTFYYIVLTCYWQWWRQPVLADPPNRAGKHSGNDFLTEHPHSAILHNTQRRTQTYKYTNNTHALYRLKWVDIRQNIRFSKWTWDDLTHQTYTSIAELRVISKFVHRSQKLYFLLCFLWSSSVWKVTQNNATKCTKI